MITTLRRLCEASQCPYCLGTQTEMNSLVRPVEFTCWACGTRWTEFGKVIWVPGEGDAA